MRGFLPIHLRLERLETRIRAGKLYPTILNAANEAAVKLFLEDNKDDFNLAMMRADTITCDGLQYLEHSIGIKNNNEYFFEKDELYKDERNFLSLFSSDDLDNYSKLVNTIVSKYEEENKRKK